MIDKLIETHPIIPVFYHQDADLTQEIILAAYQGGIRAFEFTNRGENALSVFKKIVPFAKQHCPEMALGIGTIYEVSQAKAFVEVGADFVVQPIINAQVGHYCQEKNIAWYPGAMTLNEIYQASQAGASIVKVFPGNVVGSGFIKSIKGPMPHVKLMVTGGVEPTESSLKEWFSVGVSAVGIGSQLFSKELIEKRNFDELSNKIRALMHFVQAIH